MDEKEERSFVADLSKLLEEISAIVKNRQGFGYSYADLSAVYNEVKPKIKNNGFILIQTTRRTDTVISRSDSNVPVVKDKDGSVVLSTEVNWSCPLYEIHTELFHLATSNSIVCDLPLLHDDIDPQALGSSLTYMRRYSVLVLLNIATEDDDGVQASPRGKFAQAYNKKPLPEKYEDIANFLMSCTDAKRYYMDIKNHPVLTQDQKSKLIKIIYPK